jgi:hypothetical protein
MEADNEVKGEGNSNTSFFRQLDPRLGRWLSLDPKISSFPGQSPYISMDNNPIYLMDPFGDSTFVERTKDNKFKVVGGNLEGNHNGIFIKDTKTGKVGEMIGYSLTPYSFYNSDKPNKKKRWTGTIDPNDQSGNDFFKSFVKGKHNLAEYGTNATGGQKYDFKTTNGTSKRVYSEAEDYYRGMPFGEKADNQTVYASARDIGNFCAGLMAGSTGQSWKDSRVAFDLLESKQKGKIAFEKESTVYAEALGFVMGRALYYNSTHKDNPKTLPKQTLMMQHGTKKYY